MNQYLVMCEGPNEKAIIDLLIDNNKMIISRHDLLNREVFFARQIKNSPIIQSALKTYNKKVNAIRIGDKLSDELKIPKEFAKLIHKDAIKKVCTKPELEILLVINENLFKEYNKVKNKKSPKEFAKKYIKYNREKYNNSTDFWNKYYSSDINKLVNNIKEYKRLKKNFKGEEYLADYLL